MVGYCLGVRLTKDQKDNLIVHLLDFVQKLATGLSSSLNKGGKLRGRFETSFIRKGGRLKVHLALLYHREGQQNLDIHPACRNAKADVLLRKGYFPR